MLDYEDQITDYLKENFTVSDADKANFKKTTNELLSFLFTTFPDGCISDFQLNQILIDLGYSRTTYIVETITERTEGRKKDKTTITTIHKHLTLGWCLKSHFNLKPDEFPIPAK
ncbi:hypothetical protein [Flavobacterium sp. 3HN19-14]|uniref:hypothetical protein n=1 Tax=Flavobacterium sp. 3HN19-14 TaxID=3448133 RepID=UPI003EE1E51A